VFKCKSYSAQDGADGRSVNPQTPLLAGYLTSVLCRTRKLSSQGRTLNAIVIGLGDEGADPTQNSSLLMYGQAQTPDLGANGQASGETRPILKLCVARRKPPPPPPSVRKVRPGEPLPRGTSLGPCSLCLRLLTTSTTVSTPEATIQEPVASTIVTRKFFSFNIRSSYLAYPELEFYTQARFSLPFVRTSPG
jgi:hypothetical protein